MPLFINHYKEFGIVFGSYRSPQNDLVFRQKTIALVFNPETQTCFEQELGWVKNELGDTIEIYSVQDHITDPKVLFHTNRYLAKRYVCDQITNVRIPAFGKKMKAHSGKNIGKFGVVTKFAGEWVFLKNESQSLLIRVHRDHLEEVKGSPLAFDEEVWQVTSDTAETEGWFEKEKLVELYWNLFQIKRGKA